MTSPNAFLPPNPHTYTYPIISLVVLLELRKSDSVPKSETGVNLRSQSASKPDTPNLSPVSHAKKSENFVDVDSLESRIYPFLYQVKGIGRDNSWTKKRTRKENTRQKDGVKIIKKINHVLQKRYLWGGAHS